MKKINKRIAFTLVELLVAVAVIAAGMVFVLGAFSQCLSSSETSKKMIRAGFLMSQKIWEIDVERAQSNGSIQGEWEGVFEASGGEFSWAQSVKDAEAQVLGDEAFVIEDGFDAETVSVSWLQGRKARDLSFMRYVEKSNETV